MDLRLILSDESDDHSPGESVAASSSSDSDGTSEPVPVVSLGSSIEELKREAASLQRERERLLRARYGGTGVSFQELATRHSQARHRAERLNAKLRRMMETQRGAVEGLFLAIQRADRDRQAAEAAAAFSANVDTPSRFYQHRLPLMQDCMLRRLSLVERDWRIPFNRYPQFKKRATRMDDLNFVNVNVVRDTSIETLVEVSSMPVFPFPVPSVERALWKFFAKVRCIDEDFDMTMDGASRDNESLDVRMVVVSSKDGARGSIAAPSVWRNFRNEDGQLMVISSSSGKVTLERAGVSKTEALLCEDAWLRVCGVPTGDKPTETTSSLTVVQHVRRTRLLYTGGIEPTPAQLASVKMLIANVIQNQLDWSQEDIERSLLRDESHGFSGIAV